MKFTALTAIIAESLEEKAVHSAKKAGAGSVTILKGSSIGLKEKKIFFGLTLEENVSILLLILPKGVSLKVLKALRDDLKLQEEGNNGIAFTMPISHLAGIDIEELHKFEEEIKETI